MLAREEPKKIEEEKSVTSEVVLKNGDVHPDM